MDGDHTHRGVCAWTEGERDVEFLVDSGAAYTLLPHDVWQAIGLEPKRSGSFSLSDRTRVDGLDSVVQSYL